MTGTAELIDALTDPAAWPFAVDRVEVRHTHISVLFFAGDRVYKVKKPVDLGFLDFSSLERRRFFCEEEVRLNAALAPGVHLGVVPIVALPGGVMCVAGPGQAPEGGTVIEYAVAMKRLPEGRMLDRLLDRGGIDNAVLDEITRVLLAFHRDAPTGPGVDEHGTPDTVARIVLDNLRESAAHVGRDGDGGVLSAALHAFLTRRAKAFLETHRPTMEHRVAEGRIREGHGDLHAGNICLTDDGLIIYDRIEFSPRFRCCDVARDLAFLVMDLDSRGRRAFGGYLARGYARAAGDGGLEVLLPFYKGSLAAVRGKVNALVAGDGSIDDEARAEARRSAIRYYLLAATYELPPALILTCGLPGTGKSVTARGVARPFEAAIVRSDVLRKRLAGVPPTHHPSGEEAAALYSDESNRRTYEAMLAAVRGFLDDGRTAVVDATFARAEARRAFAEIARDRGLPFAVVYLVARDDVVRKRMHRRAGDAEQVSDADWQVYLDFKDTFEPPDEIDARHLVRSSGADQPEDVAADVIDRLIDQTP